MKVNLDSLHSDELEQLAKRAATVVPGTRNPEIVLLCEHGGAQVPDPWNNLGLPSNFFDTHFGCDLWAADLTRLVAASLGATSIIANYSRLYLDYNRKREDKSCRPVDMGGIPIPGNSDISEAEVSIRERIARRPIEDAVAAWTEGSRARAVVSIHSFTPLYNGAARPYGVGVLWREDTRLAPKLVDAIRSEGHFSVEENLPYDFRSSDWFSLQRHGLDIGVPCAYIEVRNDLIDSHDRREFAARSLSNAIEAACSSLRENILQEQGTF